MRIDLIFLLALSLLFAPAAHAVQLNQAANVFQSGGGFNGGNGGATPFSLPDIVEPLTATNADNKVDLIASATSSTAGGFVGFYSTNNPASSSAYTNGATKLRIYKACIFVGTGQIYAGIGQAASGVGGANENTTTAPTTPFYFSAGSGQPALIGGNANTWTCESTDWTIGTSQMPFAKLFAAGLYIIKLYGILL